MGPLGIFVDAMTCGIKMTKFSIIPSKHNKDSRKCDLFKINETVINIKPNIVSDRRDTIRIEKNSSLIYKIRALV